LGYFEFTADVPHRIVVKEIEFLGWIKMILPLLLLIIKVEIVRSGQTQIRKVSGSGFQVQRQISRKDAKGAK